MKEQAIRRHTFPPSFQPFIQNIQKSFDNPKFFRFN